jgi:hypothetical protein
MDNKLTVELGSFRCDIGKKSQMTIDGYFAVNVFTNFDPLDQMVFLARLRDSKVVSRIANTAFYGPGMGGGLTVYLEKGKSEYDLLNVIHDYLLNPLVTPVNNIL